MKSNIAVETEQGYVKKVIAEFTSSDYLVVSKALKLLSENAEVHEIDRAKAKKLYESGRNKINETIGGLLYEQT